MRPVLIALLALLLSACDSTSPITPAPDVALMPAGNFWEDPPWGSCSPYPFEACTPNTADVAIMCGQRWGAGFGSVLSCAPPNEPPRALGCLPLIWGREQCMVDIVCPGAEEYPDTGWCCPEEVTPPPPPRTP